MFSVYLYKKLSSIKQLLANSNSNPIRPNQISHSSPNFLTIFENYLPVSYYSSTSLVNADLSSFKKKKKKRSANEDKSFTVSYLMNSHGFSRERAVSISARTHFKDLEKPKSVLALLQSYGFTDSQIASVVRKTPAILIAKEKTILPKIEFFLSIGMSKPVLATFVAMDPTWLQRSLDNLIIPNHKFLKSILLTNERVIAAMKGNSWVFHNNAEKRVGPNIKVLRELKVPESCISYLLLYYSETLNLRSDDFTESVSKVLEMGFNPLKTTFVLALRVVSGKYNKAIWDQCYETYTSWGWSKEDIYLAFRKHPNCMIMSRSKISRAMDFFVNKIGVNVKVIAQTPNVMFFSLEKRIIPRFSVIQVLLSKGLIKSFMLSTVLTPSEKHFLDKFVVPYEGEIPKLYDCYKGKVGVEDL